MVVSNHQSNLDPIVHLRALPLSLRVLARHDLFRIWLFGPALRMIGMIEVDRESPDFRQIDQAAARDLAAGHSLLAYPEGTTSPDGTVGEFKDGAFIIAIASQVPIVPAAIHGTCRIWPPGRAAIHAGQVRVVAASPLQTTGLTQHDVARLREQARDAICSAHRELVTAMSAGSVRSGEPPAGRPGAERHGRRVIPQQGSGSPGASRRPPRRLRSPSAYNASPGKLLGQETPRPRSG